MIGDHAIKFSARSHFALDSEILEVEAILTVGGEPGGRSLIGCWRISEGDEVRTVKWRIPWRDLGYLDYANVGTAMQGVVKHRKEIVALEVLMDLPANTGPYWLKSVGDARFAIQYRHRQKTVVVKLTEGAKPAIFLCLSTQSAREVGRRLSSQSRRIGIWLFSDLVKWEKLNGQR